MRKKRVFVKGAFYHVTSRTNNKIKVFQSNMGKLIMFVTLKMAKRKYHFHLANFCIMPTHIHLLIKPKENANLSVIMHWVKTISAKWWNEKNGSINHVWGNRYNARLIKNSHDFNDVMNYINQNPVSAGFVTSPEEWEMSGAYHKKHNIKELVDL